MLEGEALNEVESFTYLGSIIANTGGTEAEAFQCLKNVWKTSPLGTSTTIRISNTIVKPVLLYGAETWQTTIATTKRIQTFIKLPQIIFKIRWPDIISNQDLWKRTRQQPTEVDFFQRNRKLISHTLWKSSSNITRQALTQNPHEKRKRGQPRNLWHCDREADVRRNGYTWGELQWLAQNHDDWRVLIEGLSPDGATGNDNDDDLFAPYKVCERPRSGQSHNKSSLKCSILLTTFKV